MCLERRIALLLGSITLVALATGCAQIDSASPDPAIAGANVDVAGVGFGSPPGGTVLYDGAPAAIASWADSAITFQVPRTAQPGVHELRVHTPLGIEVATSHSTEAACSNGTAPVHVVWDRVHEASMRPLPSDEFAVPAATPTGVAVALTGNDLVPATDLIAKHNAPLLAEVSTLDGWGTSAAALVGFTGELDLVAMGATPLASASPETRQRWALDGADAPIFFVDADSASGALRGARTGAILDALGDGVLEIEPIVPLAPATRHALVITTAALGASDSTGGASRCVEASASWARIVQGSAALTDPREQALRTFLAARLPEVFTAVPALDPNAVAIALPFTTQSTVSLMQTAQTQIDARPAPTLVPGSLTVDTSAGGAVAAVVRGRFTGPDLQGVDRIWQAASSGAGFQVDGDIQHDFLLIVPAPSADHPGPFPLAIFLHSIGSSLEEANFHGDQLAALGIATIAIDAVDHTAGDPDGSILRFLNLVDVVFHAPTATRVIRDNFRQSTIDELTVLRFAHDLAASGFDVAPPLGVPDLDPARPVTVIGASLGGMMGVALSALSHDAGAASLYVAGGQVSRLVFESAVFQSLVPIFDFWLGVGDPVTEADRKEFFSLVQVVLDSADPVTFAAHVIADPLDARGPRSVLQLESVPDATISNRSNEALARAFGLAQVGPVVGPVSALALEPAPVASNVSAGITSGLFQYDDYHQTPGGPLVPSTHDSLSTALEPQQQTQTFVRSFLGGSPTIIDPFAAVGP